VALCGLCVVAKEIARLKAGLAPMPEQLTALTARLDTAALLETQEELAEAVKVLQAAGAKGGGDDQLGAEMEAAMMSAVDEMKAMVATHAASLAQLLAKQAAAEDAVVGVRRQTGEVDDRLSSEIESRALALQAAMAHAQMEWEQKVGALGRQLQALPDADWASDFEQQVHHTHTARAGTHTDAGGDNGIASM
jgi:hypothetical protein